MDDLLAERLARNEAAFRHVNERLRAGRAPADADALYPFTCECGFLGCNKLVELTVTEYEQVRSDSRWFFILDGHEIPEVERVVARHERYAVVEKNQEAAKVAEETDPRTDA